MTVEEGVEWFTNRLCDRCLAMYERDPGVLMAEFCTRCQKRILSMLFDPISG